MKRLFVTLALALAGASAWIALRPAHQADAVVPSQVIGAYRLRLKGDGWLRGTDRPYRSERIGGSAILLISRNQPDDGRVRVEIRLDPKLTGGLADLATPDPAFLGQGFIVGDSLAVIDTGGPTYVNSLTLQFLRDGAKLTGHWLSAYPAADPDAGPASAVGIDFLGKRTQLRGLDRGVRGTR